MKKTALRLLLPALLLCLLPACTGQSKQAAVFQTHTYSNLSDETSLTAVSDVLNAAGLSPARIEGFRQAVSLYNNSIEKTSLTQEGFVPWETLPPTYDEGKILELLEKQGQDFPGFNCRITSYGLLADSITVARPTPANPKDLFMDEISLDNFPLTPFTAEERAVFDALFSTVPTEHSKDVSVHYRALCKAWEEKGVSFSAPEKASLITAVFHSDLDGDELLIGHAGVLLPLGEQLLFLEKLSFELPYQAIVFSDRTELCNYLKSSYAVEWEQETAPPFFLENRDLLQP